MPNLKLDLEPVRLKLLRPHLELQLSKSWGTHNRDHREQIRADYKARGFTAKQVSVSHGKDWGGYLVDPEIPPQADPGAKLNSIGFDLELSERVLLKTVERVASSPLEVSQAPTPASLWTAKEACFKALRGPHQPQVLSQICLGRWSREPFQLETVQLLTCDSVPTLSSPLSHGIGVVVHQEFYTFSFFSVRG